MDLDEQLLEEADDDDDDDAGDRMMMEVEGGGAEAADASSPAFPASPPPPSSSSRAPLLPAGGWPRTPENGSDSNGGGGAARSSSSAPSSSTRARPRQKTPPRTPTTRSPPSKRLSREHNAGAGNTNDGGAEVAGSAGDFDIPPAAAADFDSPAAPPPPSLSSCSSSRPAAAAPAEMTVLVCRVELHDSGCLLPPEPTEAAGAPRAPRTPDPREQAVTLTSWHGGGDDYEEQEEEVNNSGLHPAVGEEESHLLAKLSASPPQHQPMLTTTSPNRGPSQHHDRYSALAPPELSSGGIGGYGGCDRRRRLPPVAPYRYVGGVGANGSSPTSTAVAVVRVPCPSTPAGASPAPLASGRGPAPLPGHGPPPDPHWMSVAVVDKHSQPAPLDLPPGLNKYWYQRRRLFHKFDDGIQLDEESWFSVSPEQVADHVSRQVGGLLLRVREARSRHQQGAALHAASPSPPFVLLDAFCGCGGNAISFAKILGGAEAHSAGSLQAPPLLGLVVAVDMDRSKLRRAAHNAGIYSIPKDRIVFVEANVLFLLEHVYRDGEFVLDRPLQDPDAAVKLMTAMPPPVPTELVDGYWVGGIDLLPRAVSLVHLDPPWGGVEYHVLGRNGYDLRRNMKIQRPGNAAGRSAAADEGAGAGEPNGELHNDFFDTFCSASDSYHQSHHGASSKRGGGSNKQQRKARFNAELSDEDCVNGEDLLRLAASACQTRIVTFDVPRNINRTSLGQAAFGAGYRGNCRLEEQSLNGRLKTVTAYFGSDWSDLAASADAPAP